MSQLENFVLYLNTAMHFGEGCLSGLEGELAKLGAKKALVTYGGGSVKKYGVLDKVKAHMGSCACVEFGGVQPNPRVSHAKKGAALAKAEGVDVIVAVGGGSVADESKAIAVGAKTEDDLWDIQMGKAPIKDALPLIVVMTMPATSSETNNMYVLTNDENGYKSGAGSPLVLPRAAFMDPAFTLTIPVTQTAYAAVDIVSHMIETYFSAQNDFAPVTFGYIEGVSRAVMLSMERILKNPEDMEARANMMWAAAIAFNGLSAAGIKGRVFYAHKLEHPLSGMYDVAHGAGLSVVTPAVLTYKKDKMAKQLVEFGKRVFDLENPQPEDTIEAFKSWYREIGAPVTFAELGVPEADINTMADQVLDLGSEFFTREDVLAMYELCK